MKVSVAQEAIERALSSLKPFQKATVEVASERLMHSEQRHLLIADETGLGKTVVAKGLIARMLKAHLANGKPQPLKITYICSNQVIAGENIEKLNFLPSELVTLRKGDRVAYMARASVENVGANTVLEINTLTPATSFQTSESQGSQWERVLIFNALLDGDPRFRRNGKSVATMLRAGVSRDSWEGNLRCWYKDTEHWGYLRRDFGNIFVAFLKEKQSKDFLNDRENKHLAEDIEVGSLIDLVWYWVNKVKPAQRDKTHWHCNQLIKVLRRAMTEVCLDLVSADLYILDEFQRFEKLIRIHESTTSEREPEQTTIARKVFGDKNSNILMLSATPFKAYSGQDDLEGADKHHSELLYVLRFLLDDNHAKLAKFESHRRDLYFQLASLTPGKSLELDTSHRREVETILRPIICRTERIQSSQDFNAMVKDSWKEKSMQIERGDILGYIATDQTIQTLSEVAGNSEARGIQPIEYCKSAPYTLSFLHGYKVRKVLDDERYRGDIKIRKTVNEQRAAWLDMRELSKYEWSSKTGPRSSRLQYLLEESLPEGADQLLWVPPSLPYYRLQDPFLARHGFSKTLVFSSWLMVPRMISTLLSYEVERMTVGNPLSRDEEKEKGVRHYFAADEKPHPRPLLTFPVKGTEDDADGPGLLSRMTNFCLLYPSRTLAEITDPFSEGMGASSLEAYREEVADRITVKLREIDFKQYEGNGKSSERWYWMAPLLLDRGICHDETERWLKDSSTRSENGYFRSDPAGSSARVQYFNSLAENFDSPKTAGLGAVPDDLAEVLAEIAIASPASTAYRAIRKLDKNLDSLSLRSWAMTIADGFTTLFNKPESIAAIRVASHGQNSANYYWRQALHYCVGGCLPAVVDEYVHLLHERFSDTRMLILFLRDSISLNSSSVRVDDVNWYLNGKGDPPVMRTHVAVQLGNQRLETPEGEKRIASLRQNFNSPFRPFVMATTSIGQEGLDFHYYCRRIVHWNLPQNPIDLEQREGRINRYKGLAIRQEIAARYGQTLGMLGEGQDVWNELFRQAGEYEAEARGGSGLVPYWAVRTENYPIERVVPLYPFSKDGARLKQMLRTLTIYRLAFGQPRQSELIEYLQENFSDEEITTIRAKLMIDLSPYNYRENS